MKKILFCIFIILVIFLISIKVNYKSNYNFYIGNNKGKYNYIYNDTRIEDIIFDIDKNITINKKNIQNLLVTSNSINIDLNGLVINKNSLIQIDLLFNKIRTYSKEKIIIILRKEENSLDKSLNMLIFKLKDKYDIIIKR